ncbi:MAG TPA: AMP-binding protein [Candidatus Angelobacter sp.]|nr:AMP-binding protein [Candidatus Angelobacter sp.]
MDLRNLVAHLVTEQLAARIFTFEKSGIRIRSHADVVADVKAACSALSSFGVGAGSRVGLRAPNSYHWMVYDLALIELKAVSIAFTDDFINTPTEDLFQRYALSLLVTSEFERPARRQEFPVAYLDGTNYDVRAIPARDLTADTNFDRIGLIFTSGSTGGLKGIELNRRGLENSVDTFTQAVKPAKDDCLLLFLPMSNLQQRLMYYSALWYGFDLAIADPPKLFHALKEFRPTILIAPPTLYEAFETRFHNLPPWKRTAAKVMGKAARAIPVPALRKKLGKLLFKDAHDALGGRMRFMITGMAPIKTSTLKLFALMQLPLYETYGLIEFGSVALNVPGSARLGSVGRPLPGVTIDFANDGEIIASTEEPQAVGYFQCGEGEAEKTFIGRGRIATGDIGRFDTDGFLYLVGRKKEIIITAGGEKVHPEVIEAGINASPDVARSVVFREPDTPFLTAVVLPNDPLDSGAKTRIEEFIGGVQNDRDAIGKIIFTDIGFTRENGFLRPNLKLDRKTIARHFQAQTSSGKGAGNGH